MDFRDALWKIEVLASSTGRALQLIQNQLEETYIFDDNGAFKRDLHNRLWRLKENIHFIRYKLLQLIECRLQQSEFKDVLHILIESLLQKISSLSARRIADATEAESSGEQIKIYLRAPVRDDPETVGYNWFAIPLQGIDFDRNVSLTPAFKEPPSGFGKYCTPVVVGPYIFIICDVEYTGKTICICGKYCKWFAPCGTRYRKVWYKNTEEVEKDWQMAPTLWEISKSCYFFALNDKIYAMGFYLGISYSLHSLDIHKLDKWQRIQLDSCEHYFKRHLSSFCVAAHAIEYETGSDSTDSQPKRAILVAPTHRIFYNFDTHKIDTAEGCERGWFCDGCNINYSYRGVCYNGVMYICSGSNDDDIKLRVYNIEKGEWGPPVIGFEKYYDALPPYSRDFATCFHLGNRRLCLLWAAFSGSAGYIHCTTFNVNVIQDQHHAENVCTKVFNIIQGIKAEHVSETMGQLAAVFTSSDTIRKYEEEHARLQAEGAIPLTPPSMQELQAQDDAEQAMWSSMQKG